MKKQNKKPAYRRVRVPLMRQTGGPMASKVGGPHNRRQEKEKTRKEIKAELD